MRSSPRAEGERDALPRTKLYPPRQQPGFVVRPRLSKKLEDGLAGGIVLVSASAGFGKTALLADWLRAAERPAAWLSLDASENDPARFWRHVAAALDLVRPGLAACAAPLVGLIPASYDGLVTAPHQSAVKSIR
jgi:LuxR family maltose regulon positive regulatory protein